MNRRPNVVVYFVDQQRPDTMGCYGQKLRVTPTLDKLAEEGTLFENAFTVQPVCGPARAVLQTGKYATETGCYRNNTSLPTEIATLAKQFNADGYETAYVGKWHLASDPGCDLKTMPVPHNRRGGYKDYWMAADVLEFTSHGYNGYMFDGDNNKVEFTGFRADCVNNYAVEYIRNKQTDTPFLLFVSQIDPHQQNDHRRFEGPMGSRLKFGDYETPPDLQNTQGDWEENYPDYLGQCHSLDENVGKLVDALKDRDMWDNTVFVYTSDHGCHFHTRPGEYKRSCHDNSIRIPMILHGPGFMGGGRIKEFVSLLDIPKTLLSSAVTETPNDFRGRDLRKLVADGGLDGWENEVYIQLSAKQTGRALRTTRWTYCVMASESCGLTPWESVLYETYLYDNQNDPCQKQNLVTDANYSEIRSELKDRLLAHMKEAGEQLPDILPYNLLK